MTEYVLYKVDDGIAYLTFNRPPANAYNYDFMMSFRDMVQRADDDPNAGCVVIKSNSPKFFCAGADIKEFGENDTSHNKRLVAQARETMSAIEHSGKIFIAQISGHALGGGLEIAMTCDVRYAATGSYLLGLPEIKLGLIPGNGGTQRLLRHVGLGRAMELLATGETFSVKEAERWGLINRLYDPEELDNEVKAYASCIVDGPAKALSATKKALLKGVDLDLASGLALEKELCDALYDTEDAQEGFAAFTQKRIPKFQGQ